MMSLLRKTAFVAGGVAVGVVIALIALVLRNHEMGIDAGQPVSTPTVVTSHKPTPTPPPVSPTVRTSPSPVQQKFVPAYSTRCGVPPGVTALSYDDSYYDGKAGKVLDLADDAASMDVGLYVFQLKQQADTYEARTGENLYDGLRGRGMYPGNHTYDHKILTEVKLSKAKWEITHGAESGWLRPPGGAYNQAILNLAYAHKQDVCTWDYDSRDWEPANGRSLTGTQICNKVVTNAPLGSVILLHLNHNAANRDALECIVDGLRAKGHKLCRPYTDTHPGESTPARLYKLPC